MPPSQESAAAPPTIRSSPAGQPGSELREALAACSGAFLGVGLFSGISNILMLTGPFFMLEVYDRVLPSHSVPTLVALSALALLLFLFQGVIDLIRGRVLVRIGIHLDEMLGHRVLGAIIALRIRAPVDNGLQPLRDLDQIRGFLAGGGPTALFDLPWIPIYLGVCFLFHPWLGSVVLGGAIALFLLTLISDVATRGLTRESAALAARRTTLTEAARRNAEVIQAMGMGKGVAARWEELNRHYRSRHFSLSNVTGNLGALARLLRVVLQSATLALGAFLVLRQEASVGIIIASSRAGAGSNSCSRPSRHARSRCRCRARPGPWPPAAWWWFRRGRRDRRSWMCPSRSRPATGWGWWGRARPANRPWCAPWWGSGSPCGGMSASTARRSINGLRMPWAPMSDICRRMSNSSTGPSARTSPASPSPRTPTP
jgi:hypothetical protein